MFGFGSKATPAEPAPADYSLDLGTSNDFQSSSTFSSNSSPMSEDAELQVNDAPSDSFAID